MTIAQAFNEIAVAQGGTASKSGTIAGAIDALNDALAGSDQPADPTIEGAVRLLGDHIGGGSGVTVEALTATENKTYTAPEGKAYSPVTVNVAIGSPNWYDITPIRFNTGIASSISDACVLSDASFENVISMISALEDTNTLGVLHGLYVAMYGDMTDNWTFNSLKWNGEEMVATPIATEIITDADENEYTVFHVPQFTEQEIEDEDYVEIAYVGE